MFAPIKPGDYGQHFEVRIIEYDHEKVVAYTGTERGAAEKCDQCLRRPGVTRAWFVPYEAPKPKDDAPAPAAGPTMSAQEALAAHRAKHGKKDD